MIYGCNERCSYCVVPTTRGSEQSRPRDAIKKEVADLVAEGYREVHPVTCSCMRRRAVICGYMRLHAVTCGRSRRQAERRE